MRHKSQLNVKLKEDYKKFWTQDLTNLNIDWDSKNLQFFIEEDEYFYPPNMRSKGKQWHLAFYIRVSARAKEDVPNIILIDEPGLFLHAKAQEDILRKLEDSAKDAPIVFSTHSPYLIDKLPRPQSYNKFHR
jgi:ABC-type lipoprotein export system ATPase subunit